MSKPRVTGEEMKLASMAADRLAEKIANKSARIGIIGLGYVGLPLGIAIAEKGFRVVGFDTDPHKVETLAIGRSYIESIADDVVEEGTSAGRFRATTDFDQLKDVDVVIVCVPTPLTRNRDPDLSAIEATANTIAGRLRTGQLVVLESTTYPGTTNEVLKPILEQSGLTCGREFFLAYSPEREDPGNKSFSTTGIPKVVGAETHDALSLATAFYSQIVPSVVPVSSTQTAEAVKLLENIFRAVNIALVNELKLVFHRMGIDVWEVIEAAKSKPFGYMPFYPGPGLGGHCIPIDPFYLTWKAREFGIGTKLIELAGEINTLMPEWVVGRIAEAIDRQTGRGLRGARVLLVGVSYKKNVDDIRESPACVIFEKLEDRGARVAFHDPHVTHIPNMRNHPRLALMQGVSLDDLDAYDCVVIVTDHDCIDYAALVQGSNLVVDTRNACGQRGLVASKIFRA